MKTRSKNGEGKKMSKGIVPWGKGEIYVPASIQQNQDFTTFRTLKTG